MTTDRVRVEFFHTQIRPAGQDLWPRPNLFTKRVFFGGPDPFLSSPVKGLGPICGQPKKKNFEA